MVDSLLRVVSFTFATLAFTAPAAPAQYTAAARVRESYLAELYSQGVDAYFSGDLEKSHNLLSEAIHQGTDDPRVLYFRGFTYQRLNRPDEARADFRKGAILEVIGDARDCFLAYFSGDLEKAGKMLTDEIGQGTNDPLVFYVRGLTHEKLGRQDEARTDFRKAADLGFRGNQPSSLLAGRVFRRIPGNLRLPLSEIRRQVRLDAYSSLARSFGSAGL